MVLTTLLYLLMLLSKLLYSIGGHIKMTIEFCTISGVQHE